MRELSSVCVEKRRRVTISTLDERLVMIKERKRKDDSDVATGVNYGVASFSKLV